MRALRYPVLFLRDQSLSADSSCTSFASPFIPYPSGLLGSPFSAWWESQTGGSQPSSKVAGHLIPNRAIHIAPSSVITCNHN